MKLPFLISVPHAGPDVPDEVAHLSLLSPEEIRADGDEGAADIYSVADCVARFVTTRIARAFVDMNRSEDDRRPDGVVKTHTCLNVKVYRSPLPEDIVECLLEKWHRPYHAQLSEFSRNAVLGIDCHTMAAVGPPVSPDPGQERPMVCLSNADGTCSAVWLLSLAECFEEAFEVPVSINHPFKGGYIIRAHAAELPWVQLELSRSPILSDYEKRKRVLEALETWADRQCP